MIYSVGIDIVRIERIEKAISKWGDRFLSRVFGQDELLYAGMKKNPALHLAARFAAKEAFFKALGCGWSGGLRWADVEVTRNSAGKPELTLRGAAEGMVREKGVQSVLLSLSHDSDYAIAQVLLIAHDPGERQPA